MFFGESQAVRAMARGTCQGQSIMDVEVHDAASGRMTQFVGDGWLAVGDAATTFDPISAQGLHHALASGLAGALAVDATLQGCTSALGEYADQVTAAFTHHREMLDRHYARETMARRAVLGTPPA